jgi:hypothetical protein
MKKGNSMISIRSFSVAACIAGLSGLLPATAHHQSGEARHFLAFWAGYQTASQAALPAESCLEGRFWEKGFVSIYAQGMEIRSVR